MTSDETGDKTGEIAQAFDHPLARAEALSDPAGDQPLDRISLRDHIVAVEIGAFDVEREVTQRLSFNVVVEVAPVTAPLEDDVDRILSYDRVTEAITAELAAERLNLLETLADNIAARILREPQAMRVFLRIEKLDRGPFKLGVEIMRRRQDTAPTQDQTAIAPQLVCLSPRAQVDPRLGAWLDAAASTGPLVVLALQADIAAEGGALSRAERNIALLAQDQAAWGLSLRDDRLSVAVSRTELDWALKQGHLPIWAPAKMVMDAATPPAGVGAADLIAWLAAELGASKLQVIGSDDMPDLAPVLRAAIALPVQTVAMD